MDGPTLLAATTQIRQAHDAPAFTVLLPTFNESLAIEFVLDDIVHALADELGRYEILVVDDASTDGTPDLVDRYATACWQCPIRVLRQPIRRGAGACRKVGVREARGSIIVMLDADGSYPAASIPELLRFFPAYDQVNGARTSEQGTWPWLRRPTKWLIRALAGCLSGKRIPDLNTGLKAFKRDAMLPWLWVVPDGFSCVTTMTLAFLTNGRAVKYVPTEYRPRIGRSKFHPLTDTWAYLCTVLRMVLYFRPLRVFVPLAGAFGLAALSLAWGQGRVGPVEACLLACAGMTGVAGLVAEVVVAQHRRP